MKEEASNHCSTKWPIRLVHVSKSLITVMAAIPRLAMRTSFQIIIWDERFSPLDGAGQGVSWLNSTLMDSQGQKETYR